MTWLVRQMLIGYHDIKGHVCINPLFITPTFIDTQIPHTVPAIASASWCSLWQENSTLGLRSLQGNCSHGGVRSFCLSTPSTSTSSITWKSWGYLSGESHASSSGLREKITDIWGEYWHFQVRYWCVQMRRTHWLNFNMVVPGAMKPVWNWIWKICVLVT